MAAWYNDLHMVSGLGQALANCGVLEDSDDFVAYLQTPQRYDDEYDAWSDANFPLSAVDEGWDEFVDALAGDDEDDDDDDDDDDEDDDEE